MIAIRLGGVPRHDCYSLATRAVVAESLGLDLDYEIFEPNGDVPGMTRASNYTLVRFYLATASVSWILDSIDAGETPEESLALCRVRDLLNFCEDVDEPFAVRAVDCASWVYGDGRRQLGMLADAWRDVSAFLVLAWPAIDSMAMRPNEGAAIAREAIPPFDWNATRSRRRPVSAVVH